MPKIELSKVYVPSDIEKHWYQHWEENNYFSADTNSKKEPYTIVIPPPNVTGMLTVGHVLNNTIQDVLIRKARMEGKEACWIPGTDHASIATETKVIEMLSKNGIKKEELTREQFLKHAWEWKEKYGGIIIQQLKRLGCSCDWERERFTMDKDYSDAVLTAFVRLYKKGLIYKGNRLVNWCPVSKSAISDEEVIHKEVDGFLWYFKYPIKDSSRFITVATTRPETMLGDTAIAINPEDSRYKNLHGKVVILPIVEREIPIILDKYVDLEFGTGCVKITPAHDPNDFVIGERHHLEFINIMNTDATLNNNVPEQFIGLSREEARKKIVKDMDSIQLLDKVENYSNSIGYSERGQVPIEFYMSKQWFMKMDDLVKPAIESVKNDKIKFHPNHWKKTYSHWMENIKDWCISRQLWWGHQIPVWYNKNNPSDIHVSLDGPADLDNWVQETDVLDTWASSWLWPMAVHSWPKESKDLAKFYPTNALVTGPDIIFFWVARMIITGHEFMNEEPFKDVYFTSLLRDSTGKKLSKSLGNSPNPLDLFDEYGTDAVRFGIMLMAPQGLDVLFTKERLEIGRNFMNKLWNACRFIDLNIPGNWRSSFNFDSTSTELSDKWILHRLAITIEKYNKNLDKFRFNEAAKTIYDFTWNDFCGWHIEISKSRFNNSDNKTQGLARNISIICIRKIIALLHPFIPFITEQLWTVFKKPEESDLIVEAWPDREPTWIDNDSNNQMLVLQNIITSVRSIRSRMNIAPSKKVDLYARSNEEISLFIISNKQLFNSLANIESIFAGPLIKKPSQAATEVSEGVELYIPLEGLVDFEKEKNQMNKRIVKLKSLIVGIEKKLSNEKFTTNAPKNIVDYEKKKMIDLKDEMNKIQINIEMLK